jgi:hypothetical protein
MTHHFRAPWDNIVQAMTIGICVLFAAIIYFAPSYISVGLAILIIGGSALFMVQSYNIKNHELIINRLGWTTKFDLQKLNAVEINRNAMSGSWRMFGIGGLFGYIGSFRNDELGNYKAYATNRHNSVILQIDGTNIVVTPDRPQDFVDAVQQVTDQQ